MPQNEQGPTAEDGSVPPDLVRGLPLALKWGLSDDVARTEQVDQASTDELNELLEQTSTLNLQNLGRWLTGPETDSESPSDNYVAFSALWMAA